MKSIKLEVIVWTEEKPTPKRGDVKTASEMEITNIFKSQQGHRNLRCKCVSEKQLTKDTNSQYLNTKSVHHELESPGHFKIGRCLDFVTDRFRVCIL